MGAMDRRVGVYIGRSERWAAELAALRQILLDTPLDETFKWRGPCYTFGGVNVIMLWGMKESCGLSFFKGVLLKDPEGMLVAPGENSRAVRMAKFTGLAGIEAAASALKACILEAIGLERAGAKVHLREDDFDLPEELAARLDDDPALKDAWEVLTPGRRRGWVLHFAQPKQPKTRTARIGKAAPRILEGKGTHDR